MAVRFIPESTQALPSREERKNVAEIIEMRSALNKIVAKKRGAGTASSPQGGPALVTNLSNEDERVGVDFETGDTQKDSKNVVELSETEVYREAVRLIARKQLTREELIKQLREKGYEDARITEVIIEFNHRLYLDDLVVARAVVETLREKKQASRAEIMRKLVQRGVERCAMETALGELDQDSERELLEHAATQRAPKLLGLDRQTAEHRLINFLARRGWRGELAVHVARQALDQAGVGTGCVSGSVI